MIAYLAKTKVLTSTDIAYIETQLGWKLDTCGVDRSNCLLNLGATLDEIIESLMLL